MHINNMNCSSRKSKRSKVVLLALLCLSCLARAEQPLIPTNEIVVEGKVKTKRVVRMEDLKKMKSVALENINTSCSPRTPETSINVIAVPLLDILDSIAFDVPGKGALNSFYFKFVASDGYTVVYSYNEIFNTDTGMHMYLVTEIDGKDIATLEKRMLLLTTNDIKSGRRNIKGLSRIVVCQAE